MADYLRDKGVYDFDLSSSYDQNRLKDWLGVQVRSSKIKPVVYYSERFFAEAIKGYLHTNEIVDTLEVFFDGYMTFEKYIYAEILELGFKDLQPVSICTIKDETQHITMDYLLGFDFSILHDDLNSFDDFVKKNQNLYIRYFVFDLPKNRKLVLSDILYPKSELDALFNAKDDSQQQIADLQAENELSDRTEQSYLTTIGLLLELCQKKTFTSQNQIIEAIIDQSIYGQKQRTLNERFSKANQALEQARKK